MNNNCNNMACMGGLVSQSSQDAKSNKSSSISYYKIRLQHSLESGFSKIQFMFYKKYIPYLVKSGRLVVIVGRMGTGKTTLCEAVCPGQVLSFYDEVRHGERYKLKMTDIPSGVFAIDEALVIEKESFCSFVQKMDDQRRGFIVATQVIDDQLRECFRSFNGKVVVFEMQPLCK